MFRTTSVISTIVVILGTGVGAARADVDIATDIAVDIDPESMLIVTGKDAPEPTFVPICLLGLGAGKHIVVVGPSGGATMIDVLANHSVSAGTRLAVEQQDPVLCNSSGMTWKISSATPVSTGGGMPALVALPAGVSLSSTDEAIVKGGADQDGRADIVCVRQGGPPLHATIWSDVPLLARDRIVDFMDLGTDPGTGEQMYLAWLDW